MSVRGAVEKVDEQRSQLPATADVTPAQMVRYAIDRQSAAFDQVMPTGFDSARFSRLVLTAVKASPDLMRCFETGQGETSVLLAAMQAAAVGLEPNTPTQDCWLLPRKRQNVWECQLSIGYRGMMKLARRSATIKTISAEVVREGDEFNWSRGLEADELRHVPGDGTGALTQAYAIARFTNGGYSFIVLNRAQIEQRRAMSDSYKSESGRRFSPWVKWEEQMWRKSALRALIPYLDLSADDARVVASDERPLRLDSDAGVIDVNEDDERPALAPVPDEIPDAQDPADVAPSGTITERDIAIAAAKAFPCDDAPRGTKTKTRDRLRYATAFMETNGRAWHMSDLTPEEMLRLHTRLEDAAAGRLEVDYDETCAVFTLGDKTATVTWQQFEGRGPASPSPSGEGEPADAGTESPSEGAPPALDLENGAQ